MTSSFERLWTEGQFPVAARFFPCCILQPPEGRHYLGRYFYSAGRTIGTNQTLHGREQAFRGSGHYRNSTRNQRC